MFGITDRVVDKVYLAIMDRYNEMEERIIDKVSQGLYDKYAHIVDGMIHERPRR